MTECIEWTGANVRGYGQRMVDGRRVLVHRWAWEQANGPIPGGMYVLHRCDNPPCYNVDHLFLGTQVDNMADMTAKGRACHYGNPGEKHPLARLTNLDVARILQLHGTGDFTHAGIAERFGVSRSAVTQVINGQRWGA